MAVSKEQIEKFKAVMNHFEQQNRNLDEDEQHQFESIFEEFKGVLTEFVEQSPNDSRLGDLAQFIQSLLESVLVYIDKKKDQQRVGKHEVDDFFHNIAKTQKVVLETISSMVKEIDELKPALDSRIARALEFTSLMEREEGSPNVASFNFDPRPASTMQHLFNLKKTLNSPRETTGRSTSRGDESKQSSKSREMTIPDNKPSDVEQQLAAEHLRHQVAVLQSELQRKDGTRI